MLACRILITTTQKRTMPLKLGLLNASCSMMILTIILCNNHLECKLPVDGTCNEFNDLWIFSTIYTAV